MYAIKDKIRIIVWLGIKIVSNNAIFMNYCTFFLNLTQPLDQFVYIFWVKLTINVTVCLLYHYVYHCEVFLNVKLFLIYSLHYKMVEYEFHFVTYVLNLSIKVYKIFSFKFPADETYIWIYTWTHWRHDVFK